MKIQRRLREKQATHLRHLSRADAHGGDEGHRVVDGVVGQVEHVHPHVLGAQFNWMLKLIIFYRVTRVVEYLGLVDQVDFRCSTILLGQ